MEPLTLEEFAEEVRREMVRAMGLLQPIYDTREGKKLGPLLMALCTKAAGIVQQAAMEREATATDRYDLAALPVEGGE